jgi:AcrR family transcriptional regulator
MSSVRSRRPSHSRESIARAAIEIADAEGFDALSMRRVARVLGAGTMTLYHYVRTKDELLAVVDNEIMGELLIPADQVPAGWRDGMREIARRTRDVFVRHPWVVAMPKSAGAGPNSTMHVEQSLAVMSGTGLGFDERLELIALVDDYVFGYIERYNPIREHAGHDPESIVGAFADDFAARMAELDPGRFPHLRALYDETEPHEALTRLVRLALDPARFDRGLDLLLDGIERRVEQRRPQSSSS